MKIFIYIFLILFLFPSFSSAEIELKFIYYMDPSSGEKVSIWENFPKEKRYHVAIKINGYWYQMLPRDGFVKSIDFVYNGPEVITRGNKSFKLLIESYVNPDLQLKDPSEKIWKNVKFKMMSAWADPTTSHCSKFVGQLLGLKPTKPRHTGQEGFFYPVEKSLSPDDIFEKINQQEGWFNPALTVKSCRKIIK